MEPEEQDGFTGVPGQSGFIAPASPEEEYDEMTEEEKIEKEQCWHHLLNPNKPLSHRHVELCKLLAKGYPHYEISKKILYSRNYISQLSCHPKIRKEVRRLQDKAFETLVNDRLAGLGHRALDVMEEVLITEDKDVKLQSKTDAAKWVLEKITGKAKQEIETKDGNLTDFMTMLKEIKEQQSRALPEGEARRAENTQGEVIDVTPHKEPEDALASWVNQNT